MSNFLDLVACEFFSNQQSAGFDRLDSTQLGQIFDSLKQSHPSYLFSEFNLFYGTERRKALAERPGEYLEWFKSRIDLFERICLPSFDNMLLKPNKWFLLCYTPQNKEENSLVEKLMKLSSSYTIAFANFRDASSDFERHYIFKPSLIKNCIEHSNPNDKQSAIITSRIDTDDALGHLYFYNLYKYLFLTRSNQNFTSKKFILNFPIGSQVTIDNESKPSKTYAQGLVFGENCFISKVEYNTSVKQLETVWNVPHDQVFGSAPVYNLVTQNPAWYQCIHGRNVQNSILESTFTIKSIDLPSFLK